MAQTRFLVKNAGEERQIFSVRDLKENGISIIFKTQEGRFGDTTLERIKDLHISVHTEEFHEDRKCFGNRIKYSIIEDNDNGYYWSSIIVKKRRDRDFIWCVDNVFSSALFGRNFEFSKNSMDEIVQLIGYVGLGETLIYSIFVSDKAVEMPLVQGFSRIVKEFHSFNLILYFSFFHMPSGQFSIRGEIARGALRKGRRPSVILGGAQDPSPFEPFTNDKFRIQRYLYTAHLTLSEIFMNVFHKTSGKIVPDILQTKFQRPSFNRWPADNDEVHEAYGEGSILKNQRYSDPDFLDGTPKPHGYVEPSGLIRVRENTDEFLRSSNVTRTRKFE